MAIARHFRSQKVGFLESLVGTAQFYLCKYQPIVGAVELINLEGVSAKGMR